MSFRIKESVKRRKNIYRKNGYQVRDSKVIAADLLRRPQYNLWNPGSLIDFKKIARVTFPYLWSHSRPDAGELFACPVAFWKLDFFSTRSGKSGLWRLTSLLFAVLLVPLLRVCCARAV
ncbi:hypothetical protein NPIL_276581 [Nephila pilipes]|uniref:Uncharacterized protein n=1 Tax=Nephila pilipes TaxID=299642 RepID=A0A8X6QZ83_NEPPI|nr:hypothetical protein NPIL_276581 [Nephila pilipes]